jgi:hypothetical protein
MSVRASHTGLSLTLHSDTEGRSTGGKTSARHARLRLPPPTAAPRQPRVHAERRRRRVRGPAAGAMGNALSWLISAIFGNKEARILILGLDNGTRRPAPAPAPERGPPAAQLPAAPH